MSDFKAFLPSYLWKLAVGLGLLAVIAMLWSQNSQPEPVVSAPTPTPGPEQNEPLSLQPTRDPVSLLPTATPIPPTPTATFTPIPVVHQVEAGEVPLEIAAAYGITVEELLSANNIDDPTRLQIGQELRIPVTVTPTPSTTPTPRVSPTPTPQPVYHTVEQGDTLLAIAAEYDTSVEAIMLANEELTDPGQLSVGQELLIPPPGPQFDTPTVLHKITGGDTFSHLSFYYGSTIDDILAANPGLDPTRLKIGQTVIIPVTSPPDNPDANPGLPRLTEPSPLPEPLVSLQQQMVTAINAHRQAEGLSPYRPGQAVTELAMTHAQDMVQRGYFAHTTPRGVTLDDRFESEQVEADWIGENIQRNNKSFEETVPHAINWFMNSRPHRANILHDRFNRIGVGVAEAPPGWYTFVLVFAERDAVEDNVETTD